MNPSIVCTWLVSRIRRNATLTLLLESRIFPDKAPEGTDNPCLIYQLLGEGFEELIDAGSLTEGSFTIQLRTYADSRLQANNIRELLRTLLQGHCGTHSINCNGELQAFTIESSSFNGYADRFDEDTGDYGAIALWRVSIA